MASGALKKTATGLTGLVVATNPHHTLGVLYSKLLRCLQNMPKEASYRKYTEELVTDRARIVKNNPDIPTIEKLINCGQIEEVILQAENELSLARKMLAWKPWEPLVEKAPAQQWRWPPVK